MDIQKRYTLLEISLAIGVSTSWINKVQRNTGIGGDIGKRGKNVYFGGDDLYVFRNVKLLRMLDYSLVDIKKLYEIEKRMISCKAINSMYKLGPEEQGYHYILHNFNFTYDEKAQPGRHIEEYDRTIADYRKWAEYIYKASVLIARRARTLEGDVKALVGGISRNVDAGDVLDRD